MNKFKNAIGWNIVVSCVLVAGCTQEIGEPESGPADEALIPALRST